MSPHASTRRAPPRPVPRRHPCVPSSRSERSSAAVDSDHARCDEVGYRSGHVYTLHMYNERLQILVTPEQRKRWELEARRRGTSVAGLIRDAVDRDMGSLDGGG